MAELINFATGLVTYSLNGGVEVTFNPTDSTFVENVSAMFDELDKKQAEYADGVKTTDNIFEFARQKDVEMREMIDSLFEHPICADLFGTLNVYAYADGLPIWANLMLAIIDVINDSCDNQKKLTSKRIEKYTAKYRKKK